MKNLSQRNRGTGVWGKACTCFVSLLLCVGLGANVSAQDETLTVLNPDEIFTDAVEVVETLPVLHLDDETRMLFYLGADALEWRTYPYPTHIEQLRLQRELSDGNFLLDSNGFNYVAFDPESGTIYYPEFICDSMLALPDEGEWVIDETPEGFVLCNTGTGETRPPLSTPCDSVSAFGIGARAISPDGRWMALSGCYAYNQRTLFAYSLETNYLHELGIVGNADIVYLERWIDDNTVVVNATIGGSFQTRRIYLADVDEPNSLEQIIGQEMIWPRYEDNPPRYFWTSDYLRSGGQLEVYEYNLETRQQTTIGQANCNISFGIGCQPSYVYPNDYNPELFVVMDGHPQAPASAVNVYRTTSPEAIYHTVVTTWANPVWLDENTLLLRDASSDFETGIDSHRFITFRGDGAIEVENESLKEVGVVSTYLSPDNRYLLLREVTSDTYYVYAMMTLPFERQLPITKPQNTHQIYFQWQEDSESLIAAAYEGDVAVGRWLLRVRE